MFSLTIETDNAAFADDETGEIVAILERLIDDMKSGKGWSDVVTARRETAWRPIRDSNGNTVGKAEFTYD